ncbi:MAG: hypothetical protein CBB68_06615 [Rhodospirillaceae bacterium TMED8]|nr:hypothetical protein [Magnetovibrio sp.]OUT51288.1 MAG: hypothetical protein CBB68_06615 [Rhodospirillaceae bacterium TMED8]
MTIKISFADLTHTGQIIAANTVPLGVAMVAAHAKQELGDAIDFEIFRYPEDFSKYLEETTPKIACFSNFSWNIRLAHEFATRLKEVAPQTICIFGGPNYPTARNEQAAFLKQWPQIDFYIDGEGEEAFIHLFKILERYEFNFNLLKTEKVKIPNTYYMISDELIFGDMLPRISDMDIIPSVYLNGMCDKFFDDKLIPMMQTSRGCPYSCTFCHEGQRYFNKTRRFSQERIREELHYIAERVQVPDIQLVDSNFGMFKEDIETTKDLATLQDSINWPKYVSVATAKNHKARVIEAANLLRGALPPGASIQTTDETILKTIKRKNLPLDAIFEVAKTAETEAANSFSEIILCLPGDSKAAHFKSVFDMIDSGINYVRMYQFMMLNGTEAASEKSRQNHEMQTVYRVLPRCFGMYNFRGKVFPVAEIEEICIANSTMPHEDYLDCRALDLSVEIFNNGGLFNDLRLFLQQHGVSRANFIKAIHQHVTSEPGPIWEIYQNYRQEEDDNLWQHLEEVESFIASPGVIERYALGEFGANELYRARALAVFENMENLHDIAFTVARQLLAQREPLEKKVDLYLEELFRFSLNRKKNVLDPDRTSSDIYKFDFVALAGQSFTDDPMDVYRPNGVAITVFHEENQKLMIEGYIKQYGTTVIGLGRILLRSHIAAMYRRVDYTNIAATEKPFATATKGKAIPRYAGIKA